MSEVISLSERRAKDDCRKWSVADALRKTLEMVEGGEIDAEMVYICMRTKPQDNEVSHPYICAGASNVEFAGLLAYHLHLHCIEN